MNARNDFLKGIGLRLLATFLMTAMSAAVRVTADTVPLGQLIFWRSFLPCSQSAYTWCGGVNFRVRCAPNIPVYMSRAVCLAFLPWRCLHSTCISAFGQRTGAWLSRANPCSSTCCILLKEKLTAHIFGAVFLGFTGVLFLLWDAFSLPSEGALIGVAAGLIFAFTMAFVRVHTKTMTQTESSSSIAFYLALVGSVVGLATIAFGWITLSIAMFGWLALAGFLGGIGHIVANEATARAPVSTLAPFDFAGLIWALGFDVILFSIVLGPMGLIGVVTSTFAALMVTFLGPSTSKPVEH